MRDGGDTGSEFRYSRYPVHRVRVVYIDGRTLLGSTRPPTDLIGRARECRSLEELLDSVRGGQSRVLVVRGDAGIGKSALLQWLVDAATGFQLVHATGVESEMTLPFAALHQLCAPMLDRLEALPEPQREAARTAFGLAAGSAPDRLLIGLAVLSLLSEFAAEAPLLCVIDDAQWLDHESAQTLAFVARRLQVDAIGLVFATRRSIAELSGFPTMIVEGLHDGDAQTLLSSVLHVPLDTRVRDRIVAETRGNPLALVEWPRGLTDAELASGFGMPAKLEMAGQIEESFRRRVAELPDSARQLLVVAAAEPTGDPIVMWRAATALGVSPDDALPAIEAGLVEIGTRVWFRHPLVRTAAYGAAPLPDRQAAHRELARATDAHVDPDRCAWHRALGSPGPDEDIADALEQSAGRARARGGMAASAALLERSVAMTLDPSKRTYRALGAASAHLNAGAVDVAASLLAQIDETSLDAIQAAYLQALRAQHAYTSGDMREAPLQFLRAAQSLETLSVRRAQDMYVTGMSAAALVGTYARGTTVSDIGRVASSCPMSTTPDGRELLVAGLALAALDDPAAAAPILRRALDTDLHAIPPEDFQWCSQLTAAASVLWDNEQLHRIAEVYLALTREVGALTMLPWALSALAGALIWEGYLDRAAPLVAEAEEILDLTGGNTAWSGATLAGWRGDANASAAIDAVETRARSAGHGLALRLALWARACMCNATGEYELALTAAREAAEQPWQWGNPSWFPELIEAAVRTGEVDVAQRQLERLAHTVGPSESDWAYGMYARSQALLSPERDAEHYYVTALDHLARTKIQTELARTHLLYGEWLRRDSQRSTARVQLRRAHELFLNMGAHGFAERARNELLATGETVRRRTVETFDELTPQEANIARLAAEGRTNPEIGSMLYISPRTVEWHLRKVYTKLNVASRRELAGALPRAKLTPA